MKSPITAAQAMSHPVVFETVNSLGQMADEFRAKVEALTKERDALSERVKALTPTLTPILCDKCGIETPDPWHSSEGTNKHIHTCDACHVQQVAVPQVYKAMKMEGRQHDTGRVYTGEGSFFADTASLKDALLIANALNSTLISQGEKP